MSHSSKLFKTIPFPQPIGIFPPPLGQPFQLVTDYLNRILHRSAQAVITVYLVLGFCFLLG